MKSSGINPDSFGQAASDVVGFPKFTPTTHKSSSISQNQNAFFEEYKSNLRNINSKKASSPNMKSSC